MKTGTLIPQIAFTLILCLVLFASTATAQGDPLVLQQKAIRRIEAFIEHFRKTGDRKSRVRDLAQAEAELAQSNRILSTREEWSALSLGLVKEGDIYRMQAQWPKTIAFYQQAVDAAKRGQDVIRQADALARKGLAEKSRNNLGQASEDALEAIRLVEKTTDQDILAFALDVLTIVQIARGDLAGAAETVSREFEAASIAKEPLSTYYAFLSRSDIYLKSGEKCDYQDSFELCYQALDHARADLQQAAAIADKLGYTALVRTTEQFIGNVEKRRTLVKFKENAQATLLKSKLFHPVKPGDVLVTEKFVPPPMEIPPALMLLYQAAQKFQKQAGGFADASMARNEFVKGLMSQMQGNNDAALGYFMKAVDLLEKDRRALHDEQSRGTFLEDRIEFYYYLILQLLERRRYADAFELLERSRSRALFDLLSSRSIGLKQSAERQLYGELQLTRTQIADLQSKLFKLQSQPDAEAQAQQIASDRTRIQSLETRYEAALARMNTEAPRLYKLVASKPADLAALQKSMREEHYEMLQYLVTEDAVILWHIAPDSVLVRNVFLPRTLLAEKVTALLKSLGRPEPDFDETTAKELFLFLVQPVLSHIQSEHLVVVPHESLHNLPFEALKDPTDGRWLGERFPITYAPSASILLDLKKSSIPRDARLFAAANPTLEEAVPEVEAIAKLFSGKNRVVVDHLVRKREIEEWVHGFDVVHLAVHGRFDAGEPMLSYVELAPGDSDDGRLTAAEMFGLALNKSPLVVLSACETGRAEATHGNEILGMARALIFAGASAMVLSHWKVDSAATSLWMQTFYEAAASSPISEAARAAMIKVKSTAEYNHPFFWAAFGVIGR